MKSICVYCGSSRGTNPAFAAAANELGQLLASQSRTLVYGAGSVGIMGEIADSTLRHGGQVIGVIPELLARPEIAHRNLTELHVTRTMHERKAMMAELSDAFIALPGGFGTFEELFEVLTWGQLGYHDKPVGLLNVAGYYDSLLQFLDDAVTARFLREGHRELLITDTDAARLLSRLEEWNPQAAERKWLDR